MIDSIFEDSPDDAFFDGESDSKALGKVEGAPATCDRQTCCGSPPPRNDGGLEECGFPNRRCGKPLPCPDHPQSTKEVAVAGGADRGPSDTGGVKGQHSAEGGHAGAEAESPITPDGERPPPDSGHLDARPRLGMERPRAAPSDTTASAAAAAESGASATPGFAQCWCGSGMAPDHEGQHLAAPLPPAQPAEPRDEEIFVGEGMAPPYEKQLGEEGVGAALIAAERVRQLEREGWTTEHDAEHVNGEMALAAACYAMPAQHRKMLPSEGYPLGWPPEWGAGWWKPAPISIIDQGGYEQPTAADRIRELSKAGALLAAEIDRLSLLRSDGPSTPRPVYDGDVSWRRIAGVGAAPEGEQEERACYHCDRPIMVPAGSPRIYTCGQCEDSAPDLSEVFAPPSASEKQDSTAGAAAVPEAGARDRLIEVETVLRDLTGAIVQAMHRGSFGILSIEPALTMALSVADGGHATLDDARIAALSSPSGHARPDPWRSPVLRYALPELLGVASDRLDRQYDNTIGDLRAAAEHFRDHPPGALRAELRRLALAFATEGSRYERAGNVSGAAQMRRVSNLLYALEKSGTAVVFTPIPGDEEAEIEKLKAAHVADRRKIMESAKLLLADKDAAEAEVLRLTKELDNAREAHRLTASILATTDARAATAEASAKALREALEAAIAAQRYQAEASPAVYEGGTLAEPEIDAIDMCAACGDGDWPCVNPACWVSRGLALLAPPNPSAEKLTPGPRE